MTTPYSPQPGQQPQQWTYQPQGQPMPGTYPPGPRHAQPQFTGAHYAEAQQPYWGPPPAGVGYAPPHASGPHQIPHQQNAGQAPQSPQAPSPPGLPRKKGGKAKWIVGGLAVLLLIGMVNGGKDTDTAATTAAPAAAAPAAVEAPASASPATDAAAPAGQGEQSYDGYGKTSGAFGEEITAGGLAVTAQAPKTLTQEFIGSQSCATVSYRNTGSTPESFSPFDWKFRTSDGVETSASIPFNADKSLNSGQLAPGGKVSGQVCADTQTTGVTSVVFSPGFGIMHEVVWSK